MQGISERVARRIEWVVHHEGDGESDVQISLFQNSGWAVGYDLAVHDYCFPRVRDQRYVDRILAPHRAGLPAVLVHGVMHSFRTGDGSWFEFCGATSHYHDTPGDFTVEPASRESPILAGMDPWTIHRGELYRTERLHPGSTALTLSRSPNEGTAQATTWSHFYGPKQARIFATTLGNEIPTLLNPSYLDLLAKGFLWAFDELKEDRFVSIAPADSLAGLVLSEPAVPLPRPGPGLTTHGRASAISTAGSALFAPGVAIDGDPDTYWEAAGPGPCSWQVDMRKERDLGAVMVSWKSEAPRRFEIESSRDGLSWRSLLAASGAGAEPITIGFDARPVRYLRVSISETTPGFVPGIREVAAYERMDDMPSAFPDFTSINGAPRAVLPRIAAKEPRPPLRVARDWRLAAWETFPAGLEVIEITPTASGGAFVLGRRGACGSRDVYLATPTGEEQFTFRRFLTDLPATTTVSWDGEWLYTLEGFELNAYRDTNGDGAADERSRIGKIFTLSERIAPIKPTWSRFRAGPDGWFYAIIETPHKIPGVNSLRDPVCLPRHGLMRFRGSGSGLRVVAEADSALADFHFGKSGAIFLRSSLLGSSRWNESGPEIRHLPALPGKAWQDLPPLVWPPSHAGDYRWGDFQFIEDNNRLYVRGEDGIFTLTAEIEGLAQAAGVGRSRFWFVTKGGEPGRSGGLGLMTRAGRERERRVDWDVIATRDLGATLSSPIPAVRTEAVFEILRRKHPPLREWAMLSGSDPALGSAGVVAAALSASGDERAIEWLIRATSSPDPPLQALAFRHLGDHPGVRNHPVFGEISRSTVAAVTGEILSAMERTGSAAPGLDELAMNLAGHPDQLLAATSRAFLRARGSVAECFSTIDNKSKEEAWPVAFEVLSGIRQRSVVDGIVLRLKKTGSARMRTLGIEALLALYYDDTVNRRPWEGTAAVHSYLHSLMQDHRVDHAGLLRGMAAAGVSLPSPSILFDLAADSVPLEPFVVQALSSLGSSDAAAIPRRVMPWLEDVAKSPKRDIELRRKALGLLITHGDSERYRSRFDDLVTFRAISPDGEGGRDLLSRWFARRDHLLQLPWLIQESASEQESTAALAWATILAVKAEQMTSEVERERISAHFDATLAQRSTPGPLGALLAALPWAGEEEASKILAAARDYPAETFREEAGQMVFERVFSGRDGSRPTSAGEVGTGALTALVSSPLGDPFVGRHLFRQLACDACHNVHGEGPAFGPDLTNSALRRSLPHLIDSILSRGELSPAPSRVALFELTEGRRLFGFETGSRGSQRDLRDRAGNAFSVESGQITRVVPAAGGIMVCDSAGMLPTNEFASLLRYLESLSE
jgi:putative heme-binding domain-containing protein